MIWSGSLLSEIPALKRMLGAGLAAAGLGVAAAAANECGRAAYVTEGSYEGANTGVGMTAAKLCSDSPGTTGAWYEYTAPIDGILNVAVKGRNLRHTLSIWEGCPESRGADLVCRDDGWGLESFAGAVVQEGHLYQIRVAAIGEGDDQFMLDVDIIPTEEGAPTDDGRAPGPDVTYQDITGIQNYGVVGGIRAYALSSDTCNIGNQNLRWGGSWAGSPSLAMNAYRLHNGRLMQIGQSWVKQACCAAAGGGCGLACNGQGGSVLGVGCLDFYSAGWNGGQSRLGPRSQINAFTGAHILAPTNTGDAILKRLQVVETDMNSANFPGATYFVEGVYAASDDAPAGNALNNASYKRVTVSLGSPFNMTPAGTMQRHVPAIQAWRANGNGVGVVDPRVEDGILDVPSEGRFHYACKVTDLGGGVYRYDYAIFNLNSDRSGGSFSVPLPPNTTVTNVGFHDVFYHSGEPYDNTDWTATVSAGAVTWSSPQTFAQNANSNALRWGTMYNFWFDANREPATGTATLGLFKPHTPQSVSVACKVPAAPAILLGDMNCDGVVSVGDIAAFVIALTDPLGYAAQFPGCNVLNGDIDQNGAVTVGDIAGFVTLLSP